MAQINYCPRCGTKLDDTMNHCPECGLKVGSSFQIKSEFNKNKKEKVFHSKKNNRNDKYWLGAAILAIVVLIIIYKSQPTKEYGIIKEQPQVINSVSYPSYRYDATYTLAYAKDGKIILPLDILKDRKMIKFDFIGNNVKIPLLAYLSEDGKVITAISMCEPCNSTDFHIQGSNLVCNSCGTTWNLNNLEAVSGSCSKYPPDPIPSKVFGNEIQIDENLVVNWQRRV